MKLVNDESKFLLSSILSERDVKALSQGRMEILRLMAKSPKYPAEIARELEIPLQLAYYHIKVLEKHGFIEFVDYAEINGGVAKRYRASSESFSVVLSDNWKEFTAVKSESPKIIAPFVRGGALQGKIIVGSPEPHGKYRARASELGVLELAMFIGRYSTFEFPAYVLDTQFNDKYKSQNLILAGGPKVNTIVAEVNDSLPVKFIINNSELHSSFSKKTYSGNIGAVQLVKSPFSKSASILVVGGINQHGTRAAVMGLVKHHKELDLGNSFSRKSLAKVVEGFDEDGDGLIDAIEILE